MCCACPSSQTRDDQVNCVHGPGPDPRRTITSESDHKWALRLLIQYRQKRFQTLLAATQTRPGRRGRR